MKNILNKLSAILVMLTCMSAMAQAEIVHHTVCEPTLNHRGFTRECWESTETGKLYSDAACTQELTGVDLAKAVVYAKLPVNPVSSTNEFDVVEFDNTETWGINMNWAVETTFSNAYSGWSSTPRSAEFRLSGKEVGDVRLVWMKNQGNQVNGRFAVKIFVKDVLTQTSTEVYSFTQNGDYEGVSVQNLQGLKKGDIVKFEVAQIREANWHEGAPTFKACLEYTIPIATEVSANEDPDNKGVFYATFYDSAKSYVIPEGATAYTGTICDDMLLLAPVKTGVIPKGEAVIIRSDSDIILLVPSNSEEAKNPDNVLRGTDIDATCPGDSYILTYAQNGIGFYSHAAGKTIAAHKAYLLMPSEVQTKALRMVFTDDEIVR